ncbi:MAG: cytochrome d ubiquinol oxidase subunit II [Verrucomicrobia bacterium RIFCSPHIGHO2_12_FULL_41_10]|nr:MAG: cytochrome d ubiquinol oxidase subunit II [Verrucomicrobia bacterium RIFCSPHIGHO2_12_FULL_41_10]
MAPYYTTIWFILVGALFTGYAMLDGFDLGVGALHLLVSKDEDRRIFLNAIGPVWDGNEVWLVVGGGALFAAFPEAYATVFSGFYMPFILLLMALIFRAVAIEFRSKEPSKIWRQTWDVLFALGSLLSSFVIGVALGNITRGIPLDSNKEFIGTFWGLFNPYSLLLGFTVMILFAMHGAIYLTMKTEGELQERVKGWVPKLILLFVFFYFAFNISTLFACPHLKKVIFSRPLIFVVLALDMFLLLNIWLLIKAGKELAAFFSSCLMMALLMMTFGLSYYPNMVISSPHPENSLTITNAASTNYTLGLLCVVVLIGVPMVLSYTTSVYWIFRGKTKLTETSY